MDRNSSNPVPRVPRERSNIMARNTRAIVVTVNRDKVTRILGDLRAIVLDDSALITSDTKEFLFNVHSKLEEIRDE